MLLESVICERDTYDQTSTSAYHFFNFPFVKISSPVFSFTITLYHNNQPLIGYYFPVNRIIPILTIQLHFLHACQYKCGIEHMVCIKRHHV